jgi:hypothetical protein
LSPHPIEGVPRLAQPKDFLADRQPMTDIDLSHLLRSWKPEPGRINARKIVGGDGRPKLQIRIDLGVLQMEIDGRPDGERPHGFESLLGYEQDRLTRYARESGIGADGFALSPDDCRMLREEAVQYYHRYVGLFAIGEYGAVIRDTTRNLEALDLCRDFGTTDLDRTVLEQFRAPILMMRARSEAELALLEGQPKQALAALDGGLDELRRVYEDSGRGEAFNDANEVQLLRGMRDALVPKVPASQKVELQERLRAAIDAENYELAAILRDELRMMEE